MISRKLDITTPSSKDIYTSLQQIFPPEFDNILFDY